MPGRLGLVGSLWLLRSGWFHVALHVLSRGTRWPGPQQACGQGRLCSPPRGLDSHGTPVSCLVHRQRLMGASLRCSHLPLPWGPWPSVQFVSSDRWVGSLHRACAVKTSLCLLPEGSVRPRPWARRTEENKANKQGLWPWRQTAKPRQEQAGLLLPRVQHGSQKVFVALFC